jgi:hypothetical protein
LSRNPIERLLRFISPGRYAQHLDESRASSPTTIVAQSQDLKGSTPPQILGAKGLNDVDVEVQADAEVESMERPNTDESAPAPTMEVAVDQACQMEPRSFGATEVSPAAIAITLHERQQVQYPKRRLTIYAFVWVIVVVSIFVRGGAAMQGLLPFCSGAYWVVGIFTALILVGVSLFAAYRSVVHASAPLVAGEPEWNVPDVRRIQLWSLLAGTLAALCGIGGGMVMGPILLNLGFLPQVQSATTATTLFVMSTSTCLAFLVSGTAPVDYSLWLAFMTGLGAIVGKTIVGWVIKWFRRPSLIMFLLGGLILVSAVVMTVTGVIDVVNDVRQGKDMLFRSFCGATDD